ncbi:MAG: hypothetical protein RH859_09110 [Longimicrobiales bacterium]
MDQRLLVFVLVIVPVVSVCLGFAVHFVIRPMVESLVLAIRDLAELRGGDPTAHHLARLEDEVEQLRHEVEALRAESRFDRQLQAPSGGEGERITGGRA